MNWYFEVLRKYAVFDGRASRQEFWMFTLFDFLIRWGILVLASAVSYVPYGSYVTYLLYLLYFGYHLALIVPSIAVQVRRLHDIGKSGVWWFVLWIPLGGFVLLFFSVLDSVPGPNEYGQNPKGINEGWVAATTAPPIARSTVSAKWMTDPTGRHQLRYWNALKWTEHVSDDGVVAIDPMSADHPEPKLT